MNEELNRKEDEILTLEIYCTLFNFVPVKQICESIKRKHFHLGFDIVFSIDKLNHSIEHKIKIKIE